jgi:hypothetical protein
MLTSMADAVPTGLPHDEAGVVASFVSPRRGHLLP